jgi:DNA-directed RNA polymerase specialized sigma24 family protein/Lon protease-like protein
MNREPDEYELALLARDGDRRALAELVERTRVRLFSLAYAELRHYEDAQDAVAAALLQICRHVTELREPERIGAWMNSIVRNEVRRLRRGPDAAVCSLESDALEGWTGAAGGRQDVALSGWHVWDAVPSLLRLDIECALRRLPLVQAQALRLFYLDGVPIREIARRVGCPEGTVKSWLHRGRQLLATQMEEYAPMAPTAPRQTAAIVHTNLETAFVRRLSSALRAAGYQPKVIKPDDPAQVPELVKGYDYIVLDEWIAGRSALELLLVLKSSGDQSAIPTCLACANPSELTASACLVAGVDRLLDKSDPEDVLRLEGTLVDPVAIPKALPVVAVRDRVYFPRMIFPLFVGRDRSVKALAEARIREKQLLLVAQKDVSVDTPGPEDLFSVGTVARVQDYLTLPDGTVRVMLTGTVRVRILEYLRTQPFISVRGEILPAATDRSPDAQTLARSVCERFEQFQQQKNGISPDAQALAESIKNQLEALVQQQNISADALGLARNIATQLDRMETQRKLAIPQEAIEMARRIDEAGVLADTITPYLPLAIEDQQALLETLPPRERLEKLRELMGWRLSAERPSG